MKRPTIFAALRIIFALVLGLLAGSIQIQAKDKLDAKAETKGAAKLDGLSLKSFDAVWNQLDEYHFDRSFNGHDWNKVRSDFRPRAAKAKDAGELRPILQEMLNLLGQSHLSIIPGDVAARIGGNDGETSDGDAEPGFEVRFWKEQFLITSVRPKSPAAEAGIKTGFIVTEINGKQISTFVKEIPAAASPSHRELLAWKYVNSKLKGAEDSEVKITCHTGKEERTFKVKRESPPGQPIKLGNFPEITAHLENRRIKTKNNRSIGYVHFNFWMLPTALKFNQVIDEYRDADGIIVDLRGNLGGLAGMVMGVAGHFIKEPTSFGTMKMRDNELQFNINPRFTDRKGEKAEPYAGPVAILLDGMSLSASELFAFGMQEVGRARIFGLRTSGQALPSVTETLPNDDVFYHPFADFISKKGTRIEGRGVIPDVEIPYSREALLSGKDQILDAALEWLGQTDARLSDEAR